MDLSTKYLGLNLKNPVVVSSCPQTGDMKSALALEKAGASAIIMPSLFEENINQEQISIERYLHNQSSHQTDVQVNNQAGAYEDNRHQYLNSLQMLKSVLEIPVIASLNGVTDGGWIQYARELEQAGADALELNVYYIAVDPKVTSQQVEQRYLDVFNSIKKHIKIPVAMKLSHQFSAIIPLVKKLEQNGVAGVSLFNRFYQPDIDLETLKIIPRLELSNPNESLLRIRWIAMLRNQVDMSLAITGGIHDVDSILKGLLAGADITCMCSALIQKGADHISDVLQHMTEWMQEKNYDSVEQFKGILSYANSKDPAAYERANYVDVLESYKASNRVTEQ